MCLPQFVTRTSRMLSKELKAGVDKLVEANPFLSARVVKKDGRMLVEPGAHSDCFFKVVDPPKECALAYVVQVQSLYAYFLCFRTFDLVLSLIECLCPWSCGDIAQVP